MTGRWSTRFATRLASKHMLLVLDNCEHLVGGVRGFGTAGARRRLRRARVGGQPRRVKCCPVSAQRHCSLAVVSAAGIEA